MIDLKKDTRDRMELRGYVKETLNIILDTVRATKPSEYIASGAKDKDSPISQEKAQGLWTDWLDQSTPIVTKGLKLAELLADDATALLEAIIAERKGTPQDQSGPTGV